MMFIRGAQVFDGTGRPPEKADVLIHGSKIAAVGSFPKKKAGNVIDGSGMWLMPGFVDVNTVSDHYLTLFSDPGQEDFLRQGVTTTIGGNCGASLAPLLYGGLESVQTWGDPNEVNVDWHTVREFFGVLRTLCLGVNFGTFVGHTTIRRALVGDVFRDLTVRELEVFKRIIEEALEDGALGLSTGFGDVHARGVPMAELEKFLPAVAASGGIYATHLRNEREGLLRSVKETLVLAGRVRVPIEISHLRPFIGSEEQFDAAVSVLDAENADVTFDLYPFDTSIIPIYTLLPRWAQSGIEEMCRNLATSHFRERIVDELRSFSGDDCRVLSAPHADYLVGKTVAAFAANRGISHAAGLLELMRVTRLRATVLVRDVSIDWAVTTLIHHPKAFVASNAPSFGKKSSVLKHECLARTFPHFFRTVTEARLLRPEAAIAKMTSLPARRFGLARRGEIKEGFFADLVLMKEGVVRDVFVNGSHAVRDGAPTGVREGVILMRRT